MANAGQHVLATGNSNLQPVQQGLPYGRSKLEEAKKAAEELYGFVKDKLGVFPTIANREAVKGKRKGNLQGAESGSLSTPKRPRPSPGDARPGGSKKPKDTPTTSTQLTTEEVIEEDSHAPWQVVGNKGNEKSNRSRPSKRMFIKGRNKGEALIANGDSYDEVLRAMRTKPELKELDVNVQKISCTRNGEMILELKKDPQVKISNGGELLKPFSLNRTLVVYRSLDPEMMAAVRFSLLGLLIFATAAPSILAAAVPCDDSAPAGGVTEWQARTPEQTLYAYVRCLNDSSATLEMKTSWVRWQPDNTVDSQCYIKCVSEDLGLVDRKERRIRPDRFIKQADAYYSGDPDKLQEFKQDAETMLAGELDEVNCQSVFSKYVEFFLQHAPIILRMFHGHYRDTGLTYDQLADQVKQLGQTFLDFCEKRHDSKLDPGDNCPSATLLDCLFRGFRWISEENELNVNEVRRDYGLSGYELDAESCESSAADARALYQCLRDKDAEKLSLVIANRNQRSAYYFDMTSQEEPWKSAVEHSKSLP
ncbi:uncharacterized protein LOC128736587 [Sabethes cyaneus]|uniref:uncharacterized protein LOC128736587 n=1 Tax=Sabethes cyaneus TaxID=53552 RepID=UPI00237DFFB7|nr:uncharacterized protein LOC128736587 [Sabethes cyaneus]